MTTVQTQRERILAQLERISGDHAYGNLRVSSRGHQKTLPAKLSSRMASAVPTSRVGVPRSLRATTVQETPLCRGSDIAKDVNETRFQKICGDDNEVCVNALLRVYNRQIAPGKSVLCFGMRA